MKKDKRDFTGIVQKIAAFSLAILFSGGLTACGNRIQKSQAETPQNSESLKAKIDLSLREAHSIEMALRSEQIYLGVDAYMRAEAVHAAQRRMAVSSDADLLQWRQMLQTYKRDVGLAVYASDRNWIYYYGSVEDLRDRRETSAAILRELRNELASRGLR